VSDESTQDEDVRPTVPRAGRVAIALGIGLALGAVALSAYAYAARVPAGQTSVYLAPAGRMLLLSLIAVCIAAATTITVAVRATAGRSVGAYASTLAAGAAAIAGYGFLGSAPNGGALLISGPGARPVVVIAQASWVVIVFAALFVLAGATSALRGAAADPPRRAAVAALVTTGLVVALTVGVAVPSFSGIGTSSATTAQPVPIPALPTDVGTNVAYKVNLRSTVILPAGPGFVATSDGAVVGYDGTTGSQRWRFPLTALPARCGYKSTRSTGISDDAVVIVQCTRPPNDTGPDQFYETDKADNVSFLVGLDAMTGEQLWLNDANWRLQGRASGDNGVFAALSPNQVAALDSRTGKPLWTRDRTDDRDCRSRYDTADSRVVFLDACDATLHVYDGNSDAVIDLKHQTGFPTDDPRVTFIAIDHDVVVVEARGYRNYSMLSIDTKTKSVQPVSIDRVNTAVPDAGSGLIPGPVLEISSDPRQHAVSLLMTTERRVVHVTGLDMYARPEEYRWARVGDRFVTAAAYQGQFEKLLSSASAGGGEATHQPNPCGRRSGAVLPVPGAMLVLCGNYSSDGAITDYDVLGLR
jgi:hypothetical protein